jgi:hypothetical protein
MIDGAGGHADERQCHTTEPLDQDVEAPTGRRRLRVGISGREVERRLTHVILTMLAR